jgi:hemerythrin superfamily protein
MDAIKLLKKQHKEVEKLFKSFEKADDEQEKRSLFDQIADNLVVHSTIEERHFYPAVRVRQVEQEIEESYDEHLEVKKLLADCISNPDAPGFDGKVAALEGAVMHHVEEEEGELFPEVKEFIDDDALEALGQIMEADAAALLEEGAPRRRLEVEIEPPAAPL